MPKKDIEGFDSKDYGKIALWTSKISDDGIVFSITGKGIEEFDTVHGKAWRFEILNELPDGEEEKVWLNYSAKGLKRLFEENSQALKGKRLKMTKVGEGTTTNYHVTYA